jgi:hypothetical protein
MILPSGVLINTEGNHTGILGTKGSNGGNAIINLFLLYKNLVIKQPCLRNLNKDKKITNCNTCYGIYQSI